MSPSLNAIEVAFTELFATVDYTFYMCVKAYWALGREFDLPGPRE